MHVPTDRNRLWDAGRQWGNRIEADRAQFGYARSGGRKAQDGRRRLQGGEGRSRQAAYRGGPHQAPRGKAPVRDDRRVGRAPSAQGSARLLALGDPALDRAHGHALASFHGLLVKPWDWVERRRRREEKIPAAEKVFSRFAPPTEGIQQGKRRPNGELGPRRWITTDQPPLIQDDAGPGGGRDGAQSGPVADRLWGRSGPGQIASLSFDNGFPRAADRQWLSRDGPTGGRPQRGKKTAAETAREREQPLVALRHPHRAGESDLHSLEPPGLNRGWDVGRAGYRR